MSDRSGSPRHDSPARVREPVARAARTAMQATPAFIVTEFIDSFFLDLSEKQYGALVGLLTLVFAFLQTATENKFGYALFRKFSHTPPAVVSTPTTPLSEPGVNVLPDPVKEAERRNGGSL